MHRGLYHAYITTGCWHLGTYSVEEQAAMAYDQFCSYQVSHQHQDVSGKTHTMHV